MRARTYDRYARIGTFLGPDRVIVSASSYVCMPHIHVCPETHRRSAYLCACAEYLTIIYREFSTTSHMYVLLWLSMYVLRWLRQQDVKNES